MKPEQLKQWRQSLNFTQAAAARSLGISEYCFWNWENGIKSPPSYLELACAAITHNITAPLSFDAQDFRQWRSKMKMSRQHAAYALDVTIRTITNWESGRAAKTPHIAALACTLLLHNFSLNKG